jgi:hypothetical protein
MPNTVSFANVPRDPHCSREVWLVEPFDEELDLWTLGSEYGFVWALLPGDPAAPRCQSLPRTEGVADIKALLQTNPSHIVLAGAMSGDGIDIELANSLISFDKTTDIDTRHISGMISRVAERLRALQYYDGDARVRQFDDDIENGGAGSDTFWGVLGIDFK